jgi:hypothetical protein
VIQKSLLGFGFIESLHTVEERFGFGVATKAAATGQPNSRKFEFI